jgi:hypothetical protein
MSSTSAVDVSIHAVSPLFGVGGASAAQTIAGIRLASKVIKSLLRMLSPAAVVVCPIGAFAPDLTGDAMPRDAYDFVTRSRGADSMPYAFPA